jgi:FkbM family methyltransferase
LKLLFSLKGVHIKEVAKYDDNLLINIDSSSYAEWLIYFMGYYEKPVIDLIKKILKENCVAFDVGANIGAHALIMGKLVGKNGKIFAFEPHPEISKRLSNNIKLNHLDNIRIFQIALSNKPGRTILYSFNEETADKGSSSLYEKTYQNLSNKFEVKVSTIDEIADKEEVAKLDLIKIDTRGSDFPVMLGAEKSIKKFKPHIIFEYNQKNWSIAGFVWKNAVEFFNKNGYGLYLINKNGVCPIIKEPATITSYNILAAPLNK